MFYTRPQVQQISRAQRVEEALKSLNSSFAEETSNKFNAALTAALKHGKAFNDDPHLGPIRALETHIQETPSPMTAPTVCGIHVDSSRVTAFSASIKEDTVSNLQLVEAVFRDPQSDSPLNLTIRDATVTASVFLRAVIEAVQELLKLQNFPSDDVTKFVLSVSHPMYQPVVSSAFLLRFEEVCQLQTDDSLCNIDLVILCNRGFQQKKVPAVVVGAINEATSILLSSSYVLPKSEPRCMVAMKIGSTFEVAYIQPNSNEFGFSGSIINLDVSNFTGNSKSEDGSLIAGLPFMSPDYEVAFINGFKHSRELELMVSLTFLPEICRRLLLQVFQYEAPSTVWVANSLSCEMCLRALKDGGDNAITRELLIQTWDWQVDHSEAEIIRLLINGVINRSALLAAICISNIAKRTGRLQPALGGVTIAMSGVLGLNKQYQMLIREQLDKIFHKNTANLIPFHDNPEGVTLGVILCNKTLSNV